MIRLKAGDINPETKAEYTVEEIKAQNEMVDLIETTAKEAMVGMISKEDADQMVKDAIKEYAEANKADYKKLYDAAMSMGTEFEHMKREARVTQTSAPKTFGDAMKESFEKNEGVQKIIAQKGIGAKEEVNIHIEKTVGTITEASSILAGSTYHSLTEYAGIFSPIRKRVEKYLGAVTVGSLSKRFAYWIEETDEEGTPVMIAESTVKTQLDVQQREKTQKVEKIAVHAKVSTEWLDDLPQFVSYLEMNLMKRVAIVMEDQLYSGNGSTPNLKGATEWATAFSAGSNANNIVSAHEIDVIENVANQSENAFGMPNNFFMHRDTLSIIKGIKGTDGHPVWNDYRDWSINSTGLRIGGMNIITTPMIPSGYFLGGDTSVINVRFREGINIRMVSSGNDPINNEMTLIVEARLAQFVSANDAPCLIKGDFATAKTALQAVA
jgi:HK97 family phage major capsid protein